MELEVRKTPVYSNSSILGPDGELLARVSQKRANWYIRRGLAEKISSEPLVVKLNFVPKGNGNKDDFYMLADKVNQCVVCAAKTELTSHHIVPREFRRNFPAELKERRSADVIILCVACHVRYEAEADKFKKELAKKYGIAKAITHQTNTRVKKLSGLSYLLLEYRDRLPKARRNEIITFLRNELDLPKLTVKILREIAEKPRQVMENSANCFGKDIVDKVEDLQKFCEAWRLHFLEYAKPSFMPPGFDIYRKV